MKANQILETSLYVHDIEIAARFYRDVLGLELHSQSDGRHAFFRCGQSMVLLFDVQAALDTEPDGPPSHGAEGTGHVAWCVRPEDLEPWRQWLKQKGVPIEKELSWPHGAHSIYFRDPSGNSLELATASLWAS